MSDLSYRDRPHPLLPVLDCRRAHPTAVGPHAAPRAWPLARAPPARAARRHLCRPVDVPHWHHPKHCIVGNGWYFMSMQPSAHGETHAARAHLGYTGG